MVRGDAQLETVPAGDPAKSKSQANTKSGQRKAKRMEEAFSGFHKF
jgi:hypothetical protein